MGHNASESVSFDKVKYAVSRNPTPPRAAHHLYAEITPSFSSMAAEEDDVVLDSDLAARLLPSKWQLTLSSTNLCLQTPFYNENRSGSLTIAVATEDQHKKTHQRRETRTLNRDVGGEVKNGLRRRGRDADDLVKKVVLVDIAIMSRLYLFWLKFNQNPIISL